MTHEIPLERHTLHGHFSRDLAPVMTIESGDTVAFSCLDSAWHVAPGDQFEPRDEKLDAGHALVGPIEVRGAKAGQTLAIRIDEVRVGSFGTTLAGGWSTPLNDRLDVPLAKSFFSTSATERPRNAASRAMPHPEMPPPMTSKSNRRLANLESCSPRLLNASFIE